MIKLITGPVAIDLPKKMEEEPAGITIKEIYSDLLKIVRSMYDLPGTESVVKDKLEKALFSEYIPYSKVEKRGNQFVVNLQLFKEGYFFRLVLE